MINVFLKTFFLITKKCKKEYNSYYQSLANVQVTFDSQKNCIVWLGLCNSLFNIKRLEYNKLLFKKEDRESAVYITQKKP